MQSTSSLTFLFFFCQSSSEQQQGLLAAFACYFPRKEEDTYQEEEAGRGDPGWLGIHKQTDKTEGLKSEQALARIHTDSQERR